MTIGTILSRGRITLPAAARRKLGLKPHGKVDVEVRENEIVIRPAKSIRDVAGIFAEAAKGKTTDWETIRDEMEKAVAEEVANEGK